MAPVSSKSPVPFAPPMLPALPPGKSNVQTVVQEKGEEGAAQYERSARNVLSISPGVSSTPAGPCVKVRMAHVPTCLEALTLELETLKNRMGRLTASSQDTGGAAMQASLVKTGERIISSLMAGKIIEDEAKRTMHSLSEMVGALESISKGHFTVEKSPNPMPAGAVSLEVLTSSNDWVRVMARPIGDANGEARLKFTQIADDGVPVPAASRLMVRIDLEGSKTPGAKTVASVDVEYGDGKPPAGQEPLDQRIHGVMLDDKGQPLLTRGGHPIVDHHFSVGIPDAMNDPAGFADFTNRFLDKVLPREQKSTP